MMQTKHKIFWRIGQEITPETFIRADHYLCSQFNLIRRLMADGNYGLLPQSENDPLSFGVKTNLNNKDISFEKLVCSGTTSAGYLIEMEDDMLTSLPRKYVSLPDSGAKTLYIVLRINPFEQVLIEPVTNEEAPMGRAHYELIVKELNAIGQDELSILKIDNSNFAPTIDPDFIPPCMSLNACSKLLETFNRIKQLLTEILSHIEQKGLLVGTNSYPLRMLYDELDDFSPTNKPVVLLRLVKKIIRTYRFFISDIRTVQAPDLLHAYNHNDMSITFQSLLSYLQNVVKVVSQGEEDFTPRI